MAIADTVTMPAQTSWVYRSVPQRIVFGTGTRTRIDEEARLAGISRAMMISTPGHAARADELATLLGDRCQTRFCGARMHTPVPVTEEAAAGAHHCVMRDFNEVTSTAAVIERMANCREQRLREIVTAVVTHLHAIVKEVEPTFEEWAFAIDFLTRTGKICDESRQEFILLSDTLGVTMLVDAINHRRHPAATESTVLGPFHVSGAPHLQMGDSISRDGKGEPLYMSGTVVDESNQPIGGARLDVWQTSFDGFYDVQDERQPEMNLRGQFLTGADGRYWFRSIKPSSYPIPSDGTVGSMLAALGRHPMRPAHVHFIVSAPGYHAVTTHVFVEGDQYLESDAVFGVKESLIIPFVHHDDPSAAARLGLGNPFYTAEYDFVLERQLTDARSETPCVPRQTDRS